MNIAIIGGGAAGCFCAIELKRRMPLAKIEIFEGSKKALTKLALTGGGKCNLTNTFKFVNDLSEVYPRGFRQMKKLFSDLDPKGAFDWFENEGISLKVQDDQRVFPASEDALEIVNMLYRRLRELNVKIHTNEQVIKIATTEEGQYSLKFSDPLVPLYRADCVVVTCGGRTSDAKFDLLEGLNLEFVSPVPSLFGFNLDDSELKQLMGTSVTNAGVSLAGTKFKAKGDVLVTDWGISGPGVLRLSSYAARFLAENAWKGTVSINWTGSHSEEEVRTMLQKLANGNPQKMLVNCKPEMIPSRLWEHLCKKSEFRADARWAEAGSKGLNRLVNMLTNYCCTITGRNKFKDEFVTCGGVALSSVNPNTLEAKKNPGLYFAGEVLDIDAVTGGFNLQAAWTTAFVVAKSLSTNYSI